MFTVSGIFCCLLLIIPAIFQIRTFPLDDIDLSSNQSLIDKATAFLQTCKHQAFFPLEDQIFFYISFALTIILSLLAISFKQKTEENSSREDNSSSERRPRTNRFRRCCPARNRGQSESVPPKPMNSSNEIPEREPLLQSPPRNEPAQRTVDAAPTSADAVPEINLPLSTTIKKANFGK